MDVIPALVADAQSPKLMQPGDGSLDDPSDRSKPAAVFCKSLRDEWFDAAPSPIVLESLGMVRAICVDAFRQVSRPADLAADRRDRFDQPDRLGDVVPVGSAQFKRER